MKVVLSGQRSFGLAVCRMLEQRRDTIMQVYAPPGDRLFGHAQDARYDVRAGGTLRADTLPSGADLIVAAHSHDFISRRARLATRFGAIGYHPSLLPRHRGRDAIEWTIRMGEPIAGGTVYWLSDTVDGGDIAMQDWCWVLPGDTASELWRRELLPMGVVLLSQVLDDIASGTIVRVRQDPDLVTWEPSLTGAPRLYRPELLMIGGAGYTVTTDRRLSRPSR